MTQDCRLRAVIIMVWPVIIVIEYFRIMSVTIYQLFNLKDEWISLGTSSKQKLACWLLLVPSILFQLDTRSNVQFLHVCDQIVVYHVICAHQGVLEVGYNTHCQYHVKNLDAHLYNISNYVWACFNITSLPFISIL